MTPKSVPEKLSETEAPASTNQPEWIEALRRQVSSLRFGVIQVVVHEGRVVQIERTEKFRFEARPATSGRIQD